MADPYSSDQEVQYRSYLKVYLKNEQLSQPVENQIAALEKKNRRKWLLLGVNIAAIIFFGYSFYYNITQLSNTLLYILAAVFVVNTGLIFYQKKQINELIAYLREKELDA